jgi:uncharacterized protein (DUF362 family)
MKLRKHRLIKNSILASLFCIFLAWDLFQAHSAVKQVYQSFFPASQGESVASLHATVAIVRSDDTTLTNPTPVTDRYITYTTIEQMVRRAVTLAGGFQGVIATGDTVLIKPNIVQQDSSGSGGVTDVRVVKALVKIVDEIDHGHIHILVGDGSPRPYTTFERTAAPTMTRWVQLFDVPGYQILRTEMLAEGIDFSLTNLNGNSDTNPWSELSLVNVPGGGYAQPQAGTYYLHHDVIRANVYITVPVMKIHDPGITVALKNQIGIAPSSRYGFSKTAGVPQDNYQHKLTHLAQAPYAWTDKEIVDLCTLARIKFVVVDAIACLETQKSPIHSGPGNHEIINQVRMNTVVASMDPVAADHVCARLMGLNPDDMEHITLAERAGLGTNIPDSIIVAGASIDSTRKRFKKSLSGSGNYGQGNREWLLKGTFAIGTISDPINYDFIPNEASVSPTPGNDGWSQSIYFINDRVNLGDYYGIGGSDRVVSYAFSYFNAPASQQAELWVGSDEAVKIYLNGNVVYSFNGARTFTNTSYYSEIVQVNINQGVNRLLVKSIQRTGLYDFSLNMCDVEPNVNYRGNRIWRLTFLANPALVSVPPSVAPSVTDFELVNCYPNPFNPVTTIRYAIPKSAHIRLLVFNALGQSVSAIVNELQEPGWHMAHFDGSSLSSGVYFCRLQAGSFSDTKKLLLMK